MCIRDSSRRYSIFRKTSKQSASLQPALAVSSKATIKIYSHSQANITMGHIDTATRSATNILSDPRMTSVGRPISKMTPVAGPAGTFARRRKRVRFADDVAALAPTARHVTWAAGVPCSSPRTADVLLVAKYEALSPTAHDWVFACGPGVDMAVRRQRWRLLYCGGREKVCLSGNSRASPVHVEPCGPGSDVGGGAAPAAVTGGAWAPAKDVRVLLAELQAFHAYRAHLPPTLPCPKTARHSTQRLHRNDDAVARQHVHFTHHMPERDLAVRTTRPTCYRMPSAAAPSASAPASAPARAAPRSRRAAICAGVKRASKFLLDYAERRAEVRARRTGVCRAAAWESFAPREKAGMERRTSEWEFDVIEGCEE